MAKKFFPRIWANALRFVDTVFSVSALSSLPGSMLQNNHVKYVWNKLERLSLASCKPSHPSLMNGIRPGAFPRLEHLNDGLLPSIRLD
jgi:hypothetical protein